MEADISPLTAGDEPSIHEVINSAADRYRGILPPAADTDPYMPLSELEAAMEMMQFFGARRAQLEGVIGIQERSDVSLVRHLYVRPNVQRQGIGTRLLETGVEAAHSGTILVGTWAAAEWAIAFYESNGFENLGSRNDLLDTYWEIPSHQMEASVVLRYEG